MPLFDDGPRPTGSFRRGVILPAEVPETVHRLAATLPECIRLGTSSWSFAGWTGICYAPALTETALARDGLAAYAAHPLMRTVSLDRTFHAPLAIDGFARYAGQVPASFRFVVKAPAAFTDPFIRRPGSGAPAGDNPTFLDAAAAAAAFVQPAIAGLGTLAGPLVFQFPPLGRRLLADLPRTIARIAAFITMLTRGRRVFVTINNKAEGSAPLSVLRLAEAIAAGTSGG